MLHGGNSDISLLEELKKGNGTGKGGQRSNEMKRNYAGC